jgi:hypothetical protein
VAAPFAAAAAERGVDLRLRWNRNRRIVARSDRHLLGRVIGNLLSNAIKYGDPAKPGGAGIVLGIVCLPNRLRIDVVDNGLGIAEGDWARVFTPFVQLHNDERDREKGSASACRSSMRSSRCSPSTGSTCVRGKGWGTRFSLELPHGDVVPDAQLRVRGHAGRRPGRPVGDSMLFYVEDDAMVPHVDNGLGSKRLACVSRPSRRSASWKRRCRRSSASPIC